MTSSTGAAAETLKDSTWTMSVVPTLAPSMIGERRHQLTTPPAANDAVISPVAVLLCRSAVTPTPAAKARKRLRERRAEEAPQVGAEGADDAAVDHVQAPQQQRHAAHEVEKDDATHKAIRLVSIMPAAQFPADALAAPDIQASGK